MTENARVFRGDAVDKDREDVEIDAAELDEEERGGPIGHIPEEMIEGILSKVSYPSIFKARLLCRSWYAKFLISHHELVHSHNTKFQNEVMEAGVKWPTYGPVSIVGKEIVGYDRSSNSWHKLEMHERVPVHLYADPFIKWRLASAGSLMCAVGESVDKSLQLLVVNTLTGDWSSLPGPPQNREHPNQDFRFVRVDSQNYKILVHNLPCPIFEAHVYESNRSGRIWTSLTKTGSMAAGIPGLSPFSAYSDAYINGTLYCMCQDTMGGMVIWKFTSETGIWEQLLRSVEFENDEFPGGMFQFGAKFIVVTLLRACSLLPASGKQSSLDAKVYELNLQSSKLTKISRSPPEHVIGMQTASLVADTECIYFCDIPDEGSASFTSFNVNNRSWSCLPSPFPEHKWKWGRFSTFEPGLNPFASP